MNASAALIAARKLSAPGGNPSPLSRSPLYDGQSNVAKSMRSHAKPDLSTTLPASVASRRFSESPRRDAAKTRMRTEYGFSIDVPLRVDALRKEGPPASRG